MTSTPSRSTKESTGTAAIEDNDGSQNSVLSSRILWENTRRRDKSSSSDVFNQHAVKIATRQLRGAIATGYHNIGFCPWPEEHPDNLNKVLGTIWKEMADNQHATANNMASVIDTKPTPFEARKV
jgi:hypothetical protein